MSAATAELPDIDSAAVVAVNALMLKRTRLAGIKRVSSPGAPRAVGMLSKT